MARRSDASLDKTSPFDALKIARMGKQQPEPVAEQPDVQMSDRPSLAASKPLAKSIDPSYIKFTTYIRKDTHRAFKLSLITKEREMSDVVEELVAEWLRNNS